MSTRDERILTEAECTSVTDMAGNAALPGGTTEVRIVSGWAGELRWARNRVSLTSDRRNVHVSINRRMEGGVGQAWTNQLDRISIESAVRSAERMIRLRPGALVTDFELPAPQLPTPSPVIWSDVTFDTTAQMRGDLARHLSEEAEARDMLSAGFLRMAGSATTTGVRGATSSMDYQMYTMAECSMTVRHPDGIGSGWAGLSGYDWSTIDAPRLASGALKKCLGSLNPVAIEPGRYTVILEPQAVYDLAYTLLQSTARNSAEMGQGPFVLGRDKELELYRLKLGLKVVDERITIMHDPEDPHLGILATAGLAPITWIEHGILKTLSNDRRFHALPKLNDNLPSLGRLSFRMSGGSAAIEDMITSTKRGLLVTRFSNLFMLDAASVLCTGLTRDGLWLIENGKRTKAVKNMRITESPLFVFNNLEQLGVPTPIFSASRNQLLSAIVPPVKANDFSFTSTADAI